MLMTEVCGAPMETSNMSRDRRKENMGVIEPFIRQTMRPKQTRNLQGTVGYNSLMRLPKDWGRSLMSGSSTLMLSSWATVSQRVLGAGAPGRLLDASNALCFNAI